MMTDSHVVGNEQCPKCRALGRDTSKDNLAIYSDGHAFCFSCGYTKQTSALTRLKQKTIEVNDEPKEEYLYLPVDCDVTYPERALAWVGQYSINKTDLFNHGVLWSESIQRLIFPIYGVDGMLLAWQGRSFNLDTTKKEAKWYGKGDLKNSFNVLGKDETLVLVEDIISAIKIAKCGYMAMPLYGSFIGEDRWARLHFMYGDKFKIKVWLDPDKRKDSIKEAHLGNTYGLDVEAMFTDRDPKDEHLSSIVALLGGV